MQAVLAAWGNSLGFRIPKVVLKSLRLSKGSKVNIQVEDDKIILSKPKYTLDELLEKVTPENIHPETDWGSPVGKEIW